MSRLRYLSKVVAFLCLGSTSAFAWAAGGYIYDAAGVVSIAADKKEAPRLARKNDVIMPGTVIRTSDNSYAVVKFEDGQVVSMQSNSTFQVREYRYEPQHVEHSNIIFSMFKGGMRFITGQIGQRNPSAFRLATPHATIGIRGTDFLVAMANNGTYSQVLSGSISMTNAAGLTILTAGQTALTPAAATLTTSTPAASVPAGTFSPIASIPVPAAVPGPLPTPPLPSAGLMGATASTGTAAAAGTTVTTAGATATTAGGAAAGGAAVSAAAVTGGAAAGISATTIGIGVGVAAVVAAAARPSSTTHH